MGLGDPVSQPAFWPQERMTDESVMMRAKERTMITTQVASSSSESGNPGSGTGYGGYSTGKSDDRVSVGGDWMKGYVGR